MKVEIKIPSVGESINEVVLGKWLKEEGSYVNMDEPICELESEKATFEINAENPGTLHIKAKEGETLPIGSTVCVIDTEGKSTAQHQPKKQPAPPSNDNIEDENKKKSNYSAGHPSPAASKMLSEKGMSPTQIEATGVGGRITKQDVIMSNSSKKLPQESMPKAPKEVTKPFSREEEKVKMTTLRKTISKRLVATKNETAMLTTFNEVNMKQVMSLRKKYKDKFKDKFGVNLGFMSFFVKASCIALQEWKTVNAKIDDNEIIYHKYCDISIAVSTPKGLVVPVVRNAESLSFSEIEQEILNLAIKGRDGKLTIDEMTGGTFTITNGGIFGSMLSTPIINAPQSAILGMHNIVERPMVENGEIKICPVMYLALSYDHRIIDGKEAVSFLVRIKEALEDPTRLLLEI